MGGIVGVVLLAHVATIMLPIQTRMELNEGKDSTLVSGLEKLRADVFETEDYDTVIVLDNNWASTVEFIVTICAGMSMGSTTSARSSSARSAARFTVSAGGARSSSASMRSRSTRERVIGGLLLMAFPEACDICRTKTHAGAKPPRRAWSW